MLSFKDWEQEVPETMKADSLWQMAAYRYALFLGDLAWHDVTKLMQDRRTLGLASQLYEAAGSISANLAEGYSRGSGKDRARFYEYSLGSARESRDRYFKSRHVLGDEFFQHRAKILEEVIRLLLVMVPQQRGRTLREAPATYNVSAPIESMPQPI
jgi:four helix bundle protein